MSADILSSQVDAAPGLLSSAEQRVLGVRLLLSLLATGCLIVSTVLRYLVPAQHDVADLVAGIAALMVTGPALSAAWHSLRHPDLHGVTDQLIAVAVIAAWAAGDLTTATLLPLVMTVGHVLEERSLLGSHEAIEALGRLTRSRARRLLASGGVEEIDGQHLVSGDRIELRAGDRIAGDGIVESGISNVDNSTITGESVPIEVGPGAGVLNGSINLDGVLTVRITGVGEETTLGRIVALMQTAEHAKPPITRLLELYAQRYLVLILLLAAGTWFVTNNAVAMLAVLVASCPCALVLAAPATSVAAIAVAGRHGILVKSAAFLEQLASVDSVVFDKTGTVTVGQLRFIAARTAPGVADHDLIRLAGSLGRRSSHPVSRALDPLAADDERLSIDDARERSGFGVTGLIDGEPVALGRPELFEELGIATSPTPDHDGPIAGVARGTRFLGWILLADDPRPEAPDALGALRALGLQRLSLVTGDRRRVADRIAGLLGLTEVRAEVLPTEKMDHVLAEIAAGHRPMVVGDGINDALALKAGAVGVAMGVQGTDVALASADLVLMTSDLRRLATCVRLSRACRRTTHVNVAIGLFGTLLVTGLAAAGYLGGRAPLVAALLHNGGTLLVMANAGRLLKFDHRLTG